jgi:two-component system LytT family response regulator
MKVLIVDDEVWARTRIRDLLSKEQGIEIAGECASGKEALAAIAAMKPDLVFLDIQLPDMNGFDVLEAVEGARPDVIFATAYDQYAIQAFDANGVDYLLKPFDEQRFRVALSRARQEPNYLGRIVVRKGGRVVFLKCAEIERLEASGNYVSVYFRGEEYLLRDTLARLEEQLDPSSFLRIHRSTIVNLDFVSHVEAWNAGEQTLRMMDGTQLTVGRTHSVNLRRQFENRKAK